MQGMVVNRTGTGNYGEEQEEAWIAALVDAMRDRWDELDREARAFLIYSLLRLRQHRGAAEDRRTRTGDGTIGTGC